ncbi:hypothetical protein SAMN02745163_02588 [Clostridium cavendishii DSM 21758]|uniref:Ribosomal protein L14E/L6E/L27E n=1 Tax=Clostridium cavendishii DSM 21758 TaxID=1121302 RepID=A0A1M6M433_9CLOT|nr:KOW domain-containing RNA-binding protein [Clostridium cavendishii]SHJ78156.1 hypothetical protein SAMN02745163_02588 [Clostridium cavendishii DSM 21758]
MQNNDLIGRLVVSKAGRDKDQSYIVVNVIDDQNVLLANGKTKTIEMPKRKIRKHVELTNVMDESIKSSILSQDKNINLIIKRFLNLNGTVKEV